MTTVLGSLVAEALSALVFTFTSGLPLATVTGWLTEEVLRMGILVTLAIVLLGQAESSPCLPITY